MATRRIEVELVGDTRNMERAFGRAQKHTSGLSNAFHTLAKASLFAGGAIVAGAAVGLERSVKAASDAQVSQARLSQSFKTAGQNINRYSGVLELAEARSRKLGFAGNEVRTALGSFMVATHSATKSVKDLAIAQDLARFKGVELETATKMITSASAGNARAIKQLGILLVPLTDHVDALKNANVKATTAAGRLAYAHAKLQDKMETAAHAVDLVREKVKGQGEAFAKTAAGSMQVFHEELQHIEVLIGSAVLPVLTKLIDKLNIWMERLSSSKRFHEDLRRGVEIVKTAFDDLGPVVQRAIGVLQKFGHGISALRSALGPEIFSGLIIGIVGAGGVLTAVAKLQVAFKAMALAAGGSGPLGLALLGLTLAIGAIAVAFIHNRDAAKTVGDAYKRVSDAARDLKDAEDGLKQSELDVAQAHLRQKQATDQVYDAQVAYNQAVKQYGVHSHQATEATHNLTQAKLDLKQADLNAAGAVRAHTRASKENVAAQKNVIESVVEAADKQRHYQSTLGAIQGAAHHTFAKLHMGWAANRNDMQSNAEKADLFAQHMRQAAAAADKAGKGGIATAYRKAAALADSLDRIPSDTEIRFVVKTLTMSAADKHHHGFAGGGRVNMGSGHADDVPAMLSRNEFVVTPGGERILESMTAPGVLNWLQGVQPRAFAGGGRVGHATKTIEFDRLYTPPAGPGGAVSTHGLVPQVTRAVGFARSHGWGGSVTSGFRTYAEQAALYARYLAGGPLAARPGTSSHERGQAVDVSDPGTFGALMGRAPGGSRLFNRLGAADPVHFSVTGYGKGGRVTKPKHHAPKLPDSIRLAEARAAGTPQLGDDIVAVGRELTWVKKELAGHDLTGSERQSLRVRRVRVENRLRSLKKRKREAEQRARGQHDYAQLPAGLQLAISNARLAVAEANSNQQIMQANSQLRAALWAAKHWLERQLRRRLTKAQRAAVIDAIASITDEIKGIVDPGDDEGGGSGDDNGDLQAQLDQANARAAAATERARLDEAFIATGVFGGGGSGGAGGSQGAGGGANGHTFNFNSLFPYTEEQARQAAAAAAQGAGRQPYRSTSVVKTGY